MWYNSESLEIQVLISGNSLLFKDIKISLGLLITVRKCMLYFGKITTSANNRSRVSNPKFEASISA